MTEVSLPLETLGRNRRVTDSNSSVGQAMLKFAATVGFAGGFLLLAIGSFINLFGYTFETGLPAAEMSQVGTILLVSAFPLLFLGAHALDKIYEEKSKRAITRTAQKRVQ